MGRVAQLVEQGTENPRVGGSTPSPATTFCAVALVLAGCTSDTCYQLCATTAQAIEPCLTEWGAGWDDFDAGSRVAWGDTCRADWDEERLSLELRQVSVANDACTAASEDLGTMSCDELRALYFHP